MTSSDMTYWVSKMESYAFVKREYWNMHVGSSGFALIKSSKKLDAHVPIATDCVSDLKLITWQVSTPSSQLVFMRKRKYFMYLKRCDTIESTNSYKKKKKKTSLLEIRSHTFHYRTQYMIINNMLVKLASLMYMRCLEWMCPVNPKNNSSEHVVWDQVSYHTRHSIWWGHIKSN